MKLKEFRVTNFRSVFDSHWISCDDVTTLVGINESGKSNILLALWKLKPVQGGEIDSLHDLPVTKLAELRNKLDSTIFIEAKFILEESAEIINNELDIGLSETDELYLSRNYAGEYSFRFDDENIQKKIESFKNTTEEATADEKEKTLITQEYVNKVIITNVPSFVYYSNYGNLSSRIYLPHVIKWLKNEKIAGFEKNEEKIRTIKVLFDYVSLKPEEILSLGKDATDIGNSRGANTTLNKDDVKQAENNKEKRILLLQSAGTKLTKEFREWWKQGEYKFHFSADGDYFYILVSDDKRPEEVDLELRSTGLQWFLSFYLIFLMETQNEHKNAVLLLDEAGQTLHPMAQKDLSLFFNKLAENNPIINTTHSPFIIDSENIDRCRVVYTDENGGTVVSENLREGIGEVGTKSIYAVHAALGLTVSDVILNGCRVIVVEGISDQYYLSAIKNYLIREKRFAQQEEMVFVPSGGVKGVQGITGLLSSKADELPMVVLDSDKPGTEFKNKLESTLYKDSKERIISIKDITKIDGSEIEDLVPYDYISSKIDRLLGVQDEDDEFEYEKNKPIIPQIEDYCLKHSIVLETGWKVEIARAFKHNLFSKKKKNLPEEYLHMWEALFNKLNS